MDRSVIAFQVVTLGMGVTLVALFLLYAILSVFGRVFQKKNAPELKGSSPARPAVLVESSTSGTDRRIVAAIVGAVSPLLLDRQSKHPFKISINPLGEVAPTAKAWVLNGRKDLMTGALKLAAIRRRGRYAEI